MARRPFDPALIRGVDEAPQPAAPAPLSPSAVNGLLRGALARHLPSTLHVVGELGDLSRPSSGHLYFTLKDAHAELRCVMWRSEALRLRFAPEGGMQAVASGALEVYAARGAVQLVVRKLEPRGVGAAEVALRQLREKLQREGLLDPARRRRLPSFPERIAIVTSPSGAALQDILQVLARRMPRIDVLILPVRVQGDGAAQQIAAALNRVALAAAQLGAIDIVIVGRGGGAAEDLWAFNDEGVARAIAGCAAPVISAVGHETDITIADLVADLRAATPTAAAELATPDRATLMETVALRQRRLHRALRHRLLLGERAVAQRIAQRSLAAPLAEVRQRGQRLDEALLCLTRACHRRMEAVRSRLATRGLAILRFRAGGALARRARVVDARLAALRRSLDRRLAVAVQQVSSARARVRQPVAAAVLDLRTLRCAEAERRVRGALRAALRAAGARLEARSDRLRACDPRSVLARGYSITRDAKSRRVLRSVREIRAGQRLSVELADGVVRVEADDPRQPTLFDGV